MFVHLKSSFQRFYYYYYFTLKLQELYFLMKNHCVCVYVMNMLFIVLFSSTSPFKFRYGLMIINKIKISSNKSSSTGAFSDNLKNSRRYYLKKSVCPLNGCVCSVASEHNRIVALLMAASWCGGCHNFTVFICKKVIIVIINIMRCVLH